MEDHLAYHSDAEKDNLQIVRRFLAINVYSLGYASDRIRGDKDIILSLIRDYNICLGNCSNQLRADQEVIDIFLSKDERNRVYTLSKEEADKRDCEVSSPHDQDQ